MKKGQDSESRCSRQSRHSVQVSSTDAALCVSLLLAVGSAPAVGSVCRDTLNLRNCKLSYVILTLVARFSLTRAHVSRELHLLCSCAFKISRESIISFALVASSSSSRHTMGIASRDTSWRKPLNCRHVDDIVNLLLEQTKQQDCGRDPLRTNAFPFMPRRSCAGWREQRRLSLPVPPNERQGCQRSVHSGRRRVSH